MIPERFSGMMAADQIVQHVTLRLRPCRGRAAVGYRRKLETKDTCMAESVDLDLTLRHYDSQRYLAELRCDLPDSDVAIETLGKTILLSFDRGQLDGLALDSDAYGLELGRMLFHNDLLGQKFSEARVAAARAQIPLRVRLNIASDAAELHTLRWETLRDPLDSDHPQLTTREQVLFSRYLGSPDWQPIRLRAQGALRALVMIANPADIADYGLAKLDAPEETRIVVDSLGAIAPTILGDDERATLATLTNHLRDGYDIVYLMAHGRVDDEGQTWLFLENDKGETEPLSGAELVTRIAELAIRPRLAILATCQSAGDGTGPALLALGPQLAMNGVPAVLAMQGNVTIETLRSFLPAFFEALQEDGQIDHALALARGEVRHRPDFWKPVLFLRLKSGSIWYRPGFTESGRGPADVKWDALLDHLDNAECTAILGPDLIENLAGTRRELARQIAEDISFPLAPHDREGLPQVAQFLAVDQSGSLLQTRVLENLCRIVRLRQGDRLPPELRAQPGAKVRTSALLGSLKSLLDFAWNAERQRNPAEIYQILASLDIPIYLTADPSDLLLVALRAAGKDPQEMFCPWNEEMVHKPSPFKEDPDYEPDPQRPLVFRLFGSYQEPDSLVLTEDSHFDYLIGVTRNKDLIPMVVRARLADTALLFLGFRPEDWAFRVFFRVLMGQEGGRRRNKYAHIAVQVAPEEGSMLEPRRARQYIETYFSDFFSEQTRINVYWGSAQDFIRELHQRR
jgi:hypothetical protein